MIDLNAFISLYVTRREKSLFLQDIENNKDILSENIKGKTVLVIGGAGSIGSSFIKAILPFEPAELVVVDINENSLAELTRDLRSTNGIYMPSNYMTYPIDFATQVFKRMFINRKGFDIVANFSAHKHVRSEKDIYSVEALLRNNVLNIKMLLELLEEYPPERYFCVSTDKAANPVNIMGASKRLMEDVIFSYSDKFSVHTARFANVAFSNGSLPSGFLSRILKHQPLSAPYDVKRYFVSPEESGQICMLACMLGDNREIFFPKLEKNQMMTFDLIATSLLQYLGYEVLECNSDEEAIQEAVKLLQGSKRYPVYYSISDTSGEKAFEEFYTETEHIELDRFNSLGVITGKKALDKGSIISFFDELDFMFSKRNTTKEQIVGVMKKYLPNFNHIETEKILDSKM